MILSSPDYDNPDWINKLYYHTNNTSLTDYYNDKESIFNDKCLNIRYTLDLLNHTVGIDPIHIRKGNIINEPLGADENYVLRARFIYSPLCYILTTHQNSLSSILNYSEIHHQNIITMVGNLSYNTVGLEKWLNGSNI